jgi:Kef-type K+ transport system membrane component KefB
MKGQVVKILAVLIPFALLVGMFPIQARAASGNADPISSVALSLALVLALAKLGGEAMVRLGQAAVAGELLVGVILGNLDLIGLPAIEHLAANPALEVLAGLGALVLLFQIGVPATVSEMARVGMPSLVAAAAGMLAPFALGWAVSWIFLPHAGLLTHIFIGAVLTATSIGVTARVLKDVGCMDRSESRIILGAAVIDDVLGLLAMTLLASVAVAMDQGSGPSWWGLGWTLAKAAGFLAGGVALGVWLAPKLFGRAAEMKAPGVLLTVGLGLCFLMSWAAAEVELAPIVGAFTAGLILEETHFSEFVRRGELSLAKQLEPIVSFLAPIFFVLVGMRADLRVFGDPAVIGFALALCIAAVMGKLAAGVAAVGRRLNGLTIGLGMVPRGEVMLVFANFGAGLSLGGRPVISPQVLSAMVAVVMVTTLATPPVLGWWLHRSTAASA